MSLQLGVREDNVIVPLLQNVVLGSNQNVSAEGCLLSLGFNIYCVKKIKCCMHICTHKNENAKFVLFQFFTIAHCMEI